MPKQGEITRMLTEAAAGGAASADQLYGLVYRELRKMAAAHLLKERPDHTMQATELVHEAYLRMVDQTCCGWNDRAHFLAIASQSMRRILVDHARRRARQKRGGGWEKVTFDDGLALGSEEAETLILDLGEALDRLEATHPEKAKVAECLFFGGLTHEECAAVLGISPRSVARRWEFAQAWLFRELNSRA